ncbi:MAG: penicillin-binding protein 2 [Oscillospiraceae bacterium]|nr:penicillin-binding protein 2 [Oscillospiraceae bacterium]
MAKRAGIVFFLFALCVGALALRLLRLPLTVSVQSGHGSARVVIDSSRGAIVDRSGAPLVQAEEQEYAAAKPTPAAANYLRSLLSDDHFAQLEPRLARGSLLATPLVGHPTLPADMKDILLLTARPRYSKQPLAPHVIGYLDGQTGAGVSGIEKSFDALLAEHAGELAVRMAADANGRSLAGARLEEENDNYCSRAGVQLTIDSGAQRAAQQALANCGVEQGAAVILDCETGEILAMASAPAFDPNQIAGSLRDPLEPFFNRALGAYPVGSTFKCFIAAAALEQGISPGTTFTCTGELDVAGRLFRCKEKTHGTLDMAGALSQSCNLYFIQLAQRMRQEPALDLIRLFGFGEDNPLAPGMKGAQGNLPTAEELALPGEWANLSFGQGKLLGTPLQLAAATACIANGGVYHSPVLVKATLDSNGVALPFAQESEQRQVISPENAALLRQMMILTVEEGSGKKAQPAAGGAGGKTATAQSGKFDSDGSELLQTGFTGFYPAEQPRYAITIFRQNGSSGAGDCAPVFREIANALAR